MHETELKVRFCETDALGHVNNISFFIYLEQARIEFFQALGIDMSPEQASFILAHLRCDFVEQAHFNQRLKVRTWVNRIGTKSVRLGHTIFDAESEQTVAEAEVVMVYFNFDKQKSEPLPAEISRQLANHTAGHP